MWRSIKAHTRIVGAQFWLQRARGSALRQPLNATQSRSYCKPTQVRQRTHQQNPTAPLSVVLRSAPQRILVVKKENDARVQLAFDRVVAHIQKAYPHVRLFHEQSPSLPAAVSAWRAGDSPPDLVITLGGDGTVLRVSSLFSNTIVPPVLSFSMGTLGFLLPFHIRAFPAALAHVFAGRGTVLNRMRLACRFQHTEDINEEWQVMNEITLHRGRSAHLTTIDTFVDGQHLTEGIADGLILSTPTGSTAYSLSAGGPIVHESVPALLLTPICPRSLSFRPLLLPGESHVALQLSEKSRAETAEVFMDGKAVGSLHRGETVLVSASIHPIPCVSRSSLGRSATSFFEDATAEDDWVRDINTLLQFNATFRNKDHGLLQPPDDPESDALGFNDLGVGESSPYTQESR
ncbi:ATP-NAD kinase [Auriculariales sp. MPI-PUGE-AT-0066]|nr:ATP-NAD kinase [Auriculariales sp. MPI-PUGE-AT-0066]